MENSIEEDIARLAKLITTKFNNDYSIDNKDKEAIEELLKAYKELKEIEESHRKENGKLRERVKELEEWNEYYRKEMLSKEYIKLNYIPKSKVKETIAELVKEYKDILSDYGNINTNLIINIPNENVKKHCGKLVEKIIVLQELLESEEQMNEKEFEELFRNTPFENIKKIQHYIDKNYIPLQKVKEMRDELARTKAEYMKWQKQELGQKDKIIDLMAETINNHDIDEDICKQMGQKANCNEFEDTEKCKECIKQYFENKAKEIK